MDMGLLFFFIIVYIFWSSAIMTWAQSRILKNRGDVDEACWLKLASLGQKIQHLTEFSLRVLR